MNTNLGRKKYYIMSDDAWLLIESVCGRAPTLKMVAALVFL